MIYRRRKHSDVWHYMPTCRWWPASNLNVHPAERDTKPTTGEFCNECRSKSLKAKR